MTRLLSHMTLIELKIPAKLYHITSAKNLPSIKANGLRAVKDYILHGTEQNTAGVNLLSDVDDYYKSFSADEVIITVSTAGLDPTKFTRFGDTWYRYEKGIPSKNFLRVAQPGKRTHVSHRL